ncbi:MAG: ATP-dependent transcriptional regulator, partial [Thioclava sp.]
LTMKTDPEKAVEAYKKAGRIYRATPGAEIQAAHIDMQLAAYALGTGRAQEAVSLVNRALASDVSSENASLVATLYMIRAEAYGQLGDATKEHQARLDMQQWARYGFGSDAAAKRRADEVAALANAGARVN